MSFFSWLKGGSPEPLPEIEVEHKTQVDYQLNSFSQAMSLQLELYRLKNDLNMALWKQKREYETKISRLEWDHRREISNIRFDHSLKKVEDALEERRFKEQVKEVLDYLESIRQEAAETLGWERVQREDGSGFWAITTVDGQLVEMDGGPIEHLIQAYKINRSEFLAE